MAGPATAFYLANQLGRSQPTVWRGVAALGDGAVRIGAARSIQYALRDTVRGLADAGYISRAAADTAALLYAFGTLTGNTDMRHGNLSFLSDVGPPCELAPAYDMLPMALAPRSGGALPTALPPPALRAIVPNATWREALALALALAQDWHTRLAVDTRFTAEWGPCQDALGQHLVLATEQAQRLG